jgi:hypothetical protein
MGNFFRSFFTLKRIIKQKLREGFEKGLCGRAGEITTVGDIAVPPLSLLVVGWICLCHCYCDSADRRR